MKIREEVVSSPSTGALDSVDVVQTAHLRSLAGAFWPRDKNGIIIPLFLYLQALDLLTTLLGIRLGAAEASPFVRLCMHAGTLVGLLVSKCVALGLAAVCLYIKRGHLLLWISYWYAGLVIWNLMMLLTASQG